MNFWTPTFHSWGKGFDPADMPWYVLYDYVEVYNYNSDSKSFDLDWRDDFNRFDQHRWHKASGSFETNSSTFYPQNVYTDNGNLVIKMEPMEEHVVEHEKQMLEDLLLHESHHYAGLHAAGDGLHHRERSEMVRDAVPGLDLTYNKHERTHLGHLMPRHDLIDEHSRDYHVQEHIAES